MSQALPWPENHTFMSQDKASSGIFIPCPALSYCGIPIPPDLNLKILRDEDAFPGSSQVIQWVKGCFDAIDRKYLRKIILGFYLNASDPDTVIETYTFRFDYFCDGINIYRNNEQIASAKTAEDTKAATIRLLRTLVVLTQTLKSLPDDVMMTMKILYFDNVTPADYEPPGFEATEYLGPTFNDEQPYKISVGDVSTPFHMVGLRVQSQLYDQLQCADEAENVLEDGVEGNGNEVDENNSYLDHECDPKITTEGEKHNKVEVPDDSLGDSENPYVSMEQEKSAPKNIPELRSQSKKEGNTKKMMNGEEAMECSTVPVQTPDIPGPNDVATGVNSRVSTQASPADEQLVPKSDQASVECSCGYNGDDGMMILCGICNNWQHASCYRCFTEEDCPALHICVTCGKNEKKECTDKTLTGMNPITLQTTCLWRRALVGCRNLTRLTAPKFAERIGVELTVAQGLMKRMQNEGFLRQATKGKRLGKLVTKEKLTVEALKNYFNSSEDEGEKTESNGSQSEKKMLGSNKKKALEKENEELQQMVQKAAQIDISGKYRTRSEASKASQKMMGPKSKGRSRKRVISSIDNDVEFSISDSQDPMDRPELANPAKKKKASSASKAILI